MPKMLERLTICAAGAAIRSGKNACVIRTTPHKLISISQAKSSSDNWANCPPNATPALLTRMLTVPWTARTAAGSARMASRSAISSTWVLTVTARQRASVAASPIGSRSTSASWHPRAASASASAAPIPLAAPVTTATAPASGNKAINPAGRARAWQRCSTALPRCRRRSSRPSSAAIRGCGAVRRRRNRRPPSPAPGCLRRPG